MPPKTNKGSTENLQWEEFRQRLDEAEKRIIKLEEKNQTLQENYNRLQQAINDTDTKIIIESALRSAEVKKIQEDIEKKQTNIRSEIIHDRPSPVEIKTPLFYGNERDSHPKKFLREMDNFLNHKKIPTVDRMLAIETCLKGKASDWFNMIKDTMINEAMFKNAFLKHFFSERDQWNIFIKCTEAGKKPITRNFQTHFHHWMEELKYLDSPKMTEEQAISLVIKHFPIAIQAYIQTSTERKFLNIWEKLGEIGDSIETDVQTVEKKQNSQGSTYQPYEKKQNILGVINQQKYQNRTDGFTDYQKKKQIRQIILTSDNEEEAEIIDNESKNVEQGSLEIDCPEL